MVRGRKNRRKEQSMVNIIKKELNQYFKGMFGYFFGAVLLMFAGVYTLIVNCSMGYASFEYTLNNMAFMYLILIPILTMRSVSEERKQRTDQLLYSLPLRMSEVIFGKYLAILIVLGIPTLIIGLHPLILMRYGAVSLRMAYICFSVILNLISFEIIVHLKVYEFVCLNIVINLFDNVVAGGTKRNKIVTGIARSGKGSDRRKLCSNFIFAHRIFAAAALPFRNLFKSESQCFRRNARILIKVKSLIFERTSREIRICHSCSHKIINIISQNIIVDK